MRIRCAAIFAFLCVSTGAVSPALAGTPFTVREMAMQCVPFSGNYPTSGIQWLPTATYPQRYLIELTGGSNGQNIAVCPYDEMNYPDDFYATSLSIDLFNPTGTQINSGALLAETCRFSNWAATCGDQAASPAVSPNNHNTTVFSVDVSAWTGITGGYGFLLLFENTGQTNFIGGYTISGNAP